MLTDQNSQPTVP